MKEPTQRRSVYRHPTDDPRHNKVTGCLCDTCQNERGWISGTVAVDPIYVQSTQIIEMLSDDDLSGLWYAAAIGDESRDEGWFYDNEESPGRLRKALEKLLAWDGSTTGSSRER